MTADADITPARDADNMRRLADALRELDARVYTDAVPEGLPFDFTPMTLARSDLWHLATLAGRLDLAFVPSSTEGYDDLIRSAETFDVFGVRLDVASLEDIIRSKEARLTVRRIGKTW